MKSMTFGTIPALEEFKTAFHNALIADGVFTGMYRIMLTSATDVRMNEELGLGIPRLSDCESLYALLDRLGAVAEGHISHGEIMWTDEQMDWAGGFASSIMTTLGFEWT